MSMSMSMSMSMANVTCDSTNSFLFGGIVNTKNGTRLRDKGGWSYTTVHEAILEKTEAIGLDKRQYELHSLRAGGASAAANAGVPDCMFKRHGSWRSGNAKDGYVEYSLTSRRQVSSNQAINRRVQLTSSHFNCLGLFVASIAMITQSLRVNCECMRWGLHACAWH